MTKIFLHKLTLLHKIKQRNKTSVMGKFYTAKPTDPLQYSQNMHSGKVIKICMEVLCTWIKKLY